MKPIYSILILFFFASCMNDVPDPGVDHVFDNPLDEEEVEYAFPALTFFPINIAVSSGESFDIEIFSMGFENLAGANIRVEYDKNRLEISSIIPGTIFEDINQEPIFFTEQNQANGWATITSSYLGGQTTSVGQEGSVAQLTFTSIVSGQSTLTFGLECEMVNPDDETIQINGFGEAVITAN